MKYYIFKNPRRKGEQPVEEMNFEPNDFIIQQKAVKHGPIMVLSEKDLLEVKKNEV